MLFQQNCQIIENRQIAPDRFKLIFESPDIAAASKPGQFLNVRCNDTDFPLLRRPFGVHRISNNNVSIIYEIKGSGTKTLSKQNPSTLLDVIGPLGHGFDLNLTKDTAVLVGGGMGIAPLMFLAQELIRIGKKIYVLIGAKTKDFVICEEDFKNLGAEVFVATEDGSYGEQGLITNILLKTLGFTTYACGPMPMLGEIAKISNKNNVVCQLSLEEFMCCGLGGCFSCVCQTKHGFQRVCKEGPVFDSKEIIF